MCPLCNYSVALKDSATGRTQQFHEADGVEDWRVVGEGACAFIRTGSFAAGARLTREISQLADLDDHHPDVDIRHDAVTVRLITITHDYYGLSERDVELARQISALARGMGLSADPSGIQNVQVSIDALVAPEVLPFWRALLAYRDRGDTPEDLIDPRARQLDAHVAGQVPAYGTSVSRLNSTLPYRLRLSPTVTRVWRLWPRSFVTSLPA